MKTFVLSVLLMLASPLAALTPTATPAPPTHAYIQNGTLGITLSGPVNPTVGQIVTLSFTVCNPTTSTVQARVIVSLEDTSVPQLAASTCFQAGPLAGQWFLGGASGGYTSFEEPSSLFADTYGGAYGWVAPGSCRSYAHPIRIPADAIPGRAYKLNIGVTDGNQAACDADDANLGHRYEVPVVLTVDTCTVTPTRTPSPTATPTIVSNIRLVKSLTGPTSPVYWDSAGYSIAWSYLALGPTTANFFEIIDTLPAEFNYSSASASSGPAPSYISLTGKVLTVRWTGSPAVSAGDAGIIQIDGSYTGSYGARTINVASARTDGPYEMTYSNQAVRFLATATYVSTFTRTPTPTMTGTMCLPCTSHTPTMSPTPTSTPDASLVDLQVTGFYITQYPIPACASGPATLGLLVGVRNNGVGFSGPFVVRVGSTDILVGGLLGGATDWVWFSGLFGPNNYTAIVDATGLVTESDEANNSLNGDVVQPTPPPSCTAVVTITPTRTGTMPAGSSATTTVTQSPSCTPSNTRTGTPTATPSPTGYPASDTATLTHSVSPTWTPFTPGPSSTHTFSATLTPAVAGSGTVTPTRTVTCPCLISATTTPTSCGACSTTPTRTVSPTHTPTATLTNYSTSGPSSTVTRTETGVPTGTITRTATGGPTGTATRTATGLVTATATRTRTPTPAPSMTRTPSPTYGVTPIVPGCVGPAVAGCTPSLVYAPVCGCNGTTYNNSSAALCAGIGAWTNGPCGTTPIPYPGLGRTWPYPVPATGSIYLGVELRTDAHLRVEVLSSRLKLISVLTGDMPAGSGRMVLDLSGFAPGVYYYKMTITYADGQVVRLAVKSFVVKR